MAEGTRLRFDGVETYLSMQLALDDPVANFTTALLQDGGLDIQDFGEGEYLALSILDANYRLREIVHLTGYQLGATFGNIERGMEGTKKATHPEGSKVVHAATVDDYLLVQEHDQDPTAHQEDIERIAQGLIDNALEAHELEANDRHPYYAKRNDPTFSGDVIFDETTNIHVYGIMTIEEGASLVIDGDLIVNGKIIINGIELYLGNEAPAEMSANMVWIQTFGVSPVK